LVGESAQQIQGVGAVRLLREDLPADLLGHRTLAALEISDGVCHGLGDGHCISFRRAKSDPKYGS
jgi:hypothetical protein